MNFLNAALLTGIAAVSIPIIIHLFHKSRFKIVKWGAMFLLEAVMRTNQRRVKIEQWILLAIRCIIPALLAFMMARPIWKGANRLLGDQKTSAVVLLDNSYSMQAGRAGTPNYTVAKDEVSRLVGALPRGSEAHVILMGQGGGGLLESPTVDLSRVTQALEKSNAGNGAADVPAALNFAASTLESGAIHEQVRKVIMMTDFQRVSFSVTETKLLSSSIERLKAQPLAPGIVFWDVGQDVKENVAIESLEFSKLMVGVGQKIQIRANLRNFGETNRPDLRVTLKVDGKDKAPSQVNLGPSAKGQVLFTTSFDTAGSHVVEIATEADALPADNSILASIPVRDRIPALLVDGAPGATPDDIKSETGYLQIALSPFAAGRVELSDLLRPSVVGVEGLNAKALTDAQVVVLANVSRLGDDQLAALTEFVKNGGGLLVFPGDKTDVAWWNGAFAKLAPLPITSIAGDLKEGAPSVGVVGQRFENPALELFNDPRNGSMSEGAVKVWFKLRPPEKTGAVGDPVVLARLDSGDPFVVEKPFGDGRVIVCATACDADWSNLPARPFYLPFVQRLCVYLASNVYPPRNLQVGQQLVSFLPADTVGKKATITGPDGKPVDVAVVKKGERGVVEFGPVREAGLYTLVPAGGAPLHFVFNTDRNESDLTRLTETEINDLAKGLGVDLVRSAEEYKSLDSKQRYGTEIWKWLLWLLLGVIFLELIVQQIFARSRGKISLKSLIPQAGKQQQETLK